MQRKTYYKTLGVSHTESPSGIRAAYRGLVKRVHPDLAGEQSTSAFREITEAYDILSDPGRRHEYDRQLTRVEHGETLEIHQAWPGPIIREPVTVLGNSGSHPAVVRSHVRPVPAPLYWCRNSQVRTARGLELRGAAHCRGDGKWLRRTGGCSHIPAMPAMRRDGKKLDASV